MGQNTSDPALTPVFQALPGAAFIVNGATPVPNSALTSAGAELRFLTGWSLGARFDGEFETARKPMPERRHAKHRCMPVRQAQ